jgi:hypothetical protein
MQQPARRTRNDKPKNYFLDSPERYIVVFELFFLQNTPPYFGHERFKDVEIYAVVKFNKSQNGVSDIINFRFLTQDY